MGDYPQAIDLLRQTLVALEGPRLHERFGLPGLPSVMSRDILARCLAELGAFTEGLAHSEDSLRMAEAVDHPQSLIPACYGIGHVSLRQGAWPQAIPWLERGLEVCRVWDFPLLFYVSSAALGDAYVLAGRVSDALPLLGEIHAHRHPPEAAWAEAAYREALALADALGMRPLLAHCHSGLGTLYLTMGRQGQARTELSSAIELYRAMDMSFWLPQAEAALAQVEGR